jgi:hypothetical protein
MRRCFEYGRWFIALVPVQEAAELSQGLQPCRILDVGRRPVPVALDEVVEAAKRRAFESRRTYDQAMVL